MGGSRWGLPEYGLSRNSKSNPSQWQSALWGEQRSKAERLYKMFNFGGLCGWVFGRALTHSRPTTELETEGQRQEVGSACSHPCTLQSRLGPVSSPEVGDSQCCVCSWHTLRAHNFR